MNTKILTRDEISANIEKMTLEARLARIAKLRPIVCERGDRMYFNYPVPQRERGDGYKWDIFDCSNWAFQYVDSEDAEKRERARAYLEEISGLDWLTAANLCREYDVLMREGIEYTGGDWAWDQLGIPARPTRGEAGFATQFTIAAKEIMRRACRLPNAAEMANLLTTLRAAPHYSTLEPNRITLKNS